MATERHLHLVPPPKPEGCPVGSKMLTPCKRDEGGVCLYQNLCESIAKDKEARREADGE